MEKPLNYTRPNWEPLARAVRYLDCPPGSISVANVIDEFMWMYESVAGVHSYKHRDTRKYAVLSEGMDDGTASLIVDKARRPQEDLREFLQGCQAHRGAPVATCNDCLGVEE